MIYVGVCVPVYDLCRCLCPVYDLCRCIGSSLWSLSVFRFQFMVEELERTRTSSHRALEELRKPVLHQTILKLNLKPFFLLISFKPFLLLIWINWLIRETKTVGRELYCRVQDLEKEQEKQEQELNIWKQRSHDQEQEVHLLRENVGHLERLRDNLEINVSEKSDLLHELRFKG